MKYLVFALLGALAVLVLVIITRTLAFKPKKQPELLEGEIDFDKDKAVSNLAELVRFKTVSYSDSSLEDDGEFEGLINALPKLYPNVFEKCEFTRFPDRGLLFKWKGRENGNPSVLMAHYDVVPVNEDAWEKPPFGGILEDGILWGRGTLDTKVTVNGILFAADKLIADGFVPENDIYFAFSGGEEVNGKGAVHIVDWFEKEGITPEMVVDEGGAVVENVFPGVDKPCGMIGIAEKGMINVKYSAKSSGGHASAPKPHTPVGLLSKACAKIESHPFKAHISMPVKELFDTLGRHSTFAMRMIFANMWCFSWVLDLICKKSGGEMNALMRTTVAFTQMSGSSAPNVIPPEAEMVSNIRLNPHDTQESALAYLKKVVDDENIEISALYGMNPSPISKVDCKGWERVSRAVVSTWKGALVSPYLMVQCSDSRHYGRISDRVYRFSAMDLTKEERGMIHGNNERIRVECACRAVEFYIRLMMQS